MFRTVNIGTLTVLIDVVGNRTSEAAKWGRRKRGMGNYCGTRSIGRVLTETRPSASHADALPSPPAEQPPAEPPSYGGGVESPIPR